MAQIDGVVFDKISVTTYLYFDSYNLSYSRKFNYSYYISSIKQPAAVYYFNTNVFRKSPGSDTKFVDLV